MKKSNKEVWIGSNDPAALKEASDQEFYELPIVDQLSQETAVEA